MNKTVRSIYIAHEEEPSGAAKIHVHFNGDTTSLKSIILMALAINDILIDDAEDCDEFKKMKKEAQNIVGMSRTELCLYYDMAEVMSKIGGDDEDE